jgi:hypothetical protein
MNIPSKCKHCPDCDYDDDHGYRCVAEKNEDGKCWCEESNED